LVNIGAWHEFNIRWIQIASNMKHIEWSKFVKATIGLYPFDLTSGEVTEKNINEQILILKKLYEENREFVVGIWECGIDLHYKGLHDKLDLQKKLFKLQLDLAQELNLPIVIHSRSAFDQTFDIVKNYKNLKIYFHCRGYGPEQLKKLQNFFPNFRVWFCGNMTYPKSEELRQGLDVVDLNSLLLETDAPYLAPQAVRWTTNKPENIQYLYQFVSKQLKKTMPFCLFLSLQD